MNELLEQLEIPWQPKPAVVVVGRMNPPTRGHYRVIDAAKAFARSELPGSRVVVVVIGGSKSDADKRRNPLSVEQRINFMKSSGAANGVEFLTATNAFEAFEAVRRAGYEPLAIAAGSDRVESYIKLLDKFFLGKNGERQKHLVVPGLDRDMDSDEVLSEEGFNKILDMIEDDDVDEEGLLKYISGSLARHAVKTGRKKAFAYLTKLEKKPKLAELMFNAVQKSLGGGNVE